MSTLLIFAVGLALLACGLYARQKYAPAKWQQTQAIVIHRKAMQQPARYGPLFTPNVQYQYEVGGSACRGDNYAFSSAEDIGTLEAVNALLQSYAEGSPINVWYQLRQPSISCIKLKSRHSQSQISAFMVAGILVIAVGASVLMAGST